MEGLHALGNTTCVLACLCLQAHCEAYNAIKKLPVGKDLKVSHGADHTLGCAH